MPQFAGLGQRLEDLDIVPGLLVEELEQALVDLGHAFLGASGGVLPHLGRGIDRLAHRLKALAGKVSARLAASRVISAALSAVCLPSSATLSPAFLAALAALSASGLAICAISVFLCGN